MGKLRQFLVAAQARFTKKQHRRPCSDCPWARHSMPGWLGSLSIEKWLQIIHGDGIIQCHTLKEKETDEAWQCAGAAIYRSNVCKDPRNPDALRLPGDKIKVFSWGEFETHHRKGLFGHEKDTAPRKLPQRKKGASA